MKFIALALEKGAKAAALDQAIEAGSSLPAQLLTVKEAAAYAKASEQSIRRWIRDYGMPALKSKNRVRIDKAELVKFLSNPAHP